MLVTGFEKKGRRVLVHFENGIKLLLNYEIFMKNGLKVNNNITEDRFSFIQDENIKYDIKQTAFNLLSRRLHSTSELKSKLRIKYHYALFIEEIIDHLTVNNYLNDAKFVQEFIAEKSKSKLWGIRKISVELRKRGIDHRIIEENLPEVDNESKSDFLLAAFEKKLRSLQHRNTPEDKIKQKIITYLLSKGFNYEDIKKIVNSHLTNPIEEME